MIGTLLLCASLAICGGCARSINLESTSPGERNFKLSAYEFMDPFTNVVKDIKAGMEKSRNAVTGVNTDSITLNGTENIDRSGQVAVANKTIDLAGQIIQAYLASQTGGASALLSKAGSTATPSAGPIAADPSVEELKTLIQEVKALKAAHSSVKKAP